VRETASQSRPVAPSGAAQADPEVDPEAHPEVSPEEDSEEDQAYFQAIEEAFVELRGSPLLLSPADWRVAQRWHRLGAPLEVVRRAMQEVFERRKERGARGKISSLKYVAPAVEAVWADLRELAAPGERQAAAEVDLGARLRSLAAALPEGLAGRGELAARIVALEGESEEIERALAALDRELLERVEAGMDGELEREVEAAVQRTLGSLVGRFDAEELAGARGRLVRQILRQRLGLPVLSLFSPEARVGEK
jgi:hypothetical protein